MWRNKSGPHTICRDRCRNFKSPALAWNRVAERDSATRCRASTRRPAFDGDEGSMLMPAVLDDRVAHRHAAVILFTMSLGVFIAQLDSQVVNLAIKSIGSDLNAGINALQWVLDSYNLFYATLLLTGGTLGDLYGRARVFAIGIGLIVLGSIVCAAAPNGAVLIAGRALTGIGSALEVP